MLRIFLMVAAVVLLGSAQAVAQIVELEGRYWFADIDAKIQIDSGSVPGTDIDFEDDLGVDTKNAPGARVTFGLPLNNKIRLAYTFLHFDGDATLERTINFSGSTFAVNTRVESELDMHYARLAWIWQPIAIPGIVKVGPMVELKGVLFETSIETRDAVPSIREDKDIGLIVPTIGAALEFTPFRFLHFFAEVSGLPAGSLGHIVDAEAGIRIVPLPFLTIAGGYRLFDVKIEHDEDRGKARMYGPFVGVSVRF
jgi:hypothetical protein